MANNDRTARLTVTLNGEQAAKTIDELKQRAESLRATYDSMLSGGNVQSKEAIAALNNVQKELKYVESQINRTAKANIDFEQTLADVSGKTAAQLNTLRSALNTSLKAMSENASKRKEYEGYLGTINAQIYKLTKGYTQAAQASQDADNLSMKSKREVLSQLRYEQDLVKTNSQAWLNYQDMIERVSNSIARTETRQKQVSAYSVARNPSGHTTSEIKTAIGQFESDKQNASVAGNATEVAALEAKLRQLYSTLGIVKKEYVDIAAVVRNPENFSPQYIEAAIQRLKEEMSSTTFSDAQREVSQRNLNLLTESYNNLTAGVKNVVDVVNNPENFSPKQIEYTISRLKDMAKDASFSDSHREDAEKNIASLTESYRNLSAGVNDVAAVVSNPENFTPKQVEAAVESLKKKMDDLTMNDPQRDGLKNQIESLNGVLKGAKENTVDVDKVLRNLKSSSLNELKAAASQLEKEMADLSTTSDEYINKSAEYKQVKNRLGDLNDAWKEHDGTIKSVMNRLVAYIGIYGAFNLAQSKIEQMVQGNLELSDSLADIQKTTGLAAKEVAELSKQIDGIDTRTSQEELHNLAYEAGKLGITGKENVFQFVEAGNQVLVALGEDLGGTDAIKNLMKINDVLGETKRLGIEKALLATGSAINEVGQSSTASEGYIADFAQRMAGVAAQSHLTMAELVALGGTTDSLGQNVEVAATTLNKVFVTLQSKTEDVARAAGVSVKALKDLLGQGETMKAFQLVLDGLSKKNGGLGELAPLFKDMGSDGARMIAVMSSMVSGVDILTQQLDTSNVAFEQATSLTNEYNVKNESANAILLRMGNSIKEYFINSTFVEWLKSALTSISYFPGWLERNYNWFLVLRTAVIALTAALSAQRVAWMANLNAMGISGVILNIKAAFFNSIGAIVAFGKAIWTATTSVAGFRTAWDALKSAMAKNWFTIALVALAAIGTAIYSLATKVSAAAKAMGEFTSELVKNQIELNGLRTAIDKANKGSSERGVLIGKLNEKYGSYLNFMLTETNYAKNQAWAYELINAKLRETLALKMKEKLVDKTMEKYAGPLQDGTETLYKAISDRLGETQANRLMPKIATLVQNYIGKSTDEISKIVSDYLSREGMRAGSMIYPREYIKAQKNIAMDIKQSTMMQDAQIESSGQQASRLQEKKLKEMNGSILGSKNIVDLKNYISLAESYMNTLDKTSKKYKTYAYNIQEVEKRLEKLGVKKDVPGFDGNPYTDKELKKMETAAQRAARIALQNQNKMVKELMDGVDEYFTQQETKINDAYAKGLLSDSQRKIKLQENERAHNLAKAELIKAFLKEKNDFNAKEFGMTAEQQKKLEKLNVNSIKTTKEQRDKDVAEQQKQLSESQKKEAELRAKHREDINKILQDNDELGKVKSEYEEKFNLLGVYSVGVEQNERELSEKRMALLTELSKNSRTMTVETLKSNLLNNQEFGDLTQTMTENQYQALLLTLQQYLDDTEEAEAKARSRRRRVVDTLWKNSNDNKSSQANIRDTDAGTLEDKNRQTLGLLDESDAKDIEIIRAQARMDALQREYDFKVALGEQDVELQNQLAEKRAEMDQLYLESLKMKQDKMRQYTDIIASFTEQMGQAAFGEVKSRKEAGKQIINSLMDVTKKMIIQWATRKAMNLLFKQAENADNAAQAAVSVGITKTQAAVEAGTSVAKAGVDVAAGIASGTAKEVGSKGWLGIAIGAAIAAVLGGLLSMVQSKMASAFGDSDVSSQGSSAPRIAAGMLTYADGRYPVLGNDGKIYNPKYQGELKTGVYNETSMGIFSEKEPEMVVSGPTTRKLMLDYPEIMQAIQIIDRGGRIKTYADGRMPGGSLATVSPSIDINALAAAVASVLKPALDNVATVNAELNNQLRSGISTNIQMYGKSGLMENIKKANEFYAKNKLDK